ncbi:MAG: hypothetical protein ABFR75_07595 [Acidobacteriota bacterium]
MKKYIFFSIVFIFSINIFGELFSQFADSDKESLKNIIGIWKFSDRNYLYEFTDTFVRKIDGFFYYKYRSSKYPRYDNFIYSIFRSRKTDVSFFCRGNWDKKRGFVHVSSRIRFIGDNKFVVYKKENPRKVYFTAVRVDQTH